MCRALRMRLPSITQRPPHQRDAALQKRSQRQERQQQRGGDSRTPGRKRTATPAASAGVANKGESRKGNTELRESRPCPLPEAPRLFVGLRHASRENESYHTPASLLRSPRVPPRDPATTNRRMAKTATVRKEVSTEM
ncbi:unnamed protein product, partial [Ectocarpus fasciculatus]